MDVDSERTPDLSAMLGSLLRDPSVMAQVQQALSSVKEADSTPQVDAEEAHGQTESEHTLPPAPTLPPELGALLQNGALMSQLPAMLGMLSSATGKPTQSGGGGSGGGKSGDHRTALLLALKPYLSSGRCQMIDSIVNLNRLGDLLGKRPNH